jgi:uncharacterized RDD family membrane protein YckC
MNPDDDGNRYAPPQALVEDIAPEPGSNPLATRWARLGAALIDGLLLLGLMWVLSKVTPWTPFKMPDTGEVLSTKLVNAMLGALLFMTVNGYLLLRHGQTIGKKIVGLRIVRPNGEPVSPGRLLGGRYLVGWALSAVPVVGQAWGLIDALFIFRESRRCLHDSIADTIVVRA